MTIEIIRQSTPLEREIWQFRPIVDHSSETVIVLNYYYRQNRSTVRHKWINEAYYDRLSSRQSRIKAESVPLPIEVETEAIEQFMKLVRVAKEL